VTLAFSGKMMAREDLSKILNCVSLIIAALWYVTFSYQFTERLIEQSQTIAGLFNLILKNLLDVEVIVNEVFTKQLTLGLIFGPIYRKDQKILNDACTSIISVGKEIPANSLIERY
jgi:hypothetical protein